MSSINASGKVVAVDENDEDGTVSIGIHSQRVSDAGEPSFKLTYEFPTGSPLPAQFPINTIVTFAIDTAPPAAPAEDQITSTTTLGVSGAADTGIVPEAPQPASTLLGPDDSPIFTTPASDVPAPELTDETPAFAQPGMENASIDDVKAHLGL